MQNLVYRDVTMHIFNGAEVSTPNPCVVQGSTLWLLRSPGEALVPVSVHMTFGTYRSALAVTLLSV